MGLAGAFGGQAYTCRACGHTMAEYAPHCPICLNKNLTKINNEKQPGPSATSPGIPGLKEFQDEGNKPGLPLGMIVAVMLALMVVAYSVFFAPKQQPAPVQQVQAPAPKAEPVRPRRVIKRPVAQAPKRTSASASTGTAPRRAAPMKLWTVTDDE